MKIGALFAGYGGLDSAVSQVTGAELAWVCEWDDAPSKILAHHYPDVPNYKDVSQVDWAAVEPVDILTGGFPCQDVSLAGARRGLKDGTRSGLWSEFAKAIDVIRPRLVVIENVRGLLSATAHSSVEQCSWCLGDESGESALRALGAVLGDLADLGYDARWKGVRAADAGAPHNRYRIFIIAYPSGRRDGGGMTSPAMAKAKGQTLRLSGQIVDLVEPGRLPTPTVADQFTGALKSTQQSAGSMHSVSLAQVFHREDLFPTVTTRDHKDGTIAPAKHRPDDKDTLTRAMAHKGSEWGQYEKSIRRWEKVIGREAPKPTEPTGRHGQQQLSARFTEWMMGLDDGWITSPEIGLTRNEALKACGNGVVPQQAVLALTVLLDGVDW